MNIFIAGASGAIGKRLIPLLAERGHQVTGLTRTEAKRSMLEELGATPVVADALNADAIAQALAETEPDVVVHQLTAIDGQPNMRRFDQSFAQTNRLRTEGTDILLSAARAAGAAHFVAQSFAGWPYARVGGPVKTEDDPLDESPPKGVRESIAAIKHLERAVLEAEGIAGTVLRYGGFYGPGTSFSSAPESMLVTAIAKRRLPVVADGEGRWSFIHIDDAATATVAAIESSEPGLFNIVDDEPTRTADWLPGLASLLGAKQPLRVPRWLGRLLAGEVATLMMTEARGASNAKAKRTFGWHPGFPTWREGFAHGLG